MCALIRTLPAKPCCFLPNAVVGVETKVHLSQTVVFEEVVQQADHCVGAFTCLHCLIDEVVYLLGHSFTAHSEDGALPVGLFIKKGHTPVYALQQSAHTYTHPHHSQTAFR